MTGQPTLCIENYALAYKTEDKPFRVLDGVSLTIDKGEIVGLVGESGSGKSSLAYAVMRDLSGQIDTERGTIRLSGRDLMTGSQPQLAGLRGKTMAMVFQDPGGSLNPTLSLGAQIVEVLRRHRNLQQDAAVSEARRLFGMVGLPDPELMLEKLPHEVSGGEKQRVVIAIAFACDPELILFDEPTAALDATTAVNILDLFRSLQQRSGVSALFISHDLGAVAEIADRVAVIYAGRIVETGPVADLFDAPRHPYTRALLASLPRPTRAGRDRFLRTIPGSLPNRKGEGLSCGFEARCPFADNRCRQQRIELESDGRREVACVRWRELSSADLPAEQPDAEGAGTRPREIGQEPLLEMERLTVRIGRWGLFTRLLGGKPRIVHAVDQVSLRIAHGETLGLVGESGCGKSTLARALVGLRAFEGTVRLSGQEIAGPHAMADDYRRNVQIIFQNPDSSLNPRQKIGTILSRPLQLYRDLPAGQIVEEVRKLLSQVRLPPDYASRYPHELSGGEKQRVAIARAVAAQPSIIICDEITSGLDASVQASIVNLMKELQDRLGIAYLFITHDLNLLRYIADRVATMYLGQIVELRPAGALSAPPYHPYTEALLSSAPTLDGRLETRRIRLHGAMPTRTQASTGCPFESRCPKKIDDICAATPPPAVSFDDGHWLRCHLDEASLRTVPPIWMEAPAIDMTTETLK